MKMLLLLLCAVALVLGVARIARAIPIEFTNVWYPTASPPHDAAACLWFNRARGLQEEVKKYALTIWSESHESDTSR